MLKRATRPLVLLVDRYLPDPYIIVLILTVLVFVLGSLLPGQDVVSVLGFWGDGFWDLLAFSMQMLLVLVTGFILANTPAVQFLLNAVARRLASPTQAIITVTLFSMLASWINWGFGLVVGAMFAKAVAKTVRVDFRLLVASAYSGFIVWHGGLSGSVPLAIATPGHFAEEAMGVIPASETIFSVFNLVILVTLALIIPVINVLMMPGRQHSVFVDPDALSVSNENENENVSIKRPADRLEHSPILSYLIAGAGAIFLLNHFFSGGTLNLNIVNFTFLVLAIFLHKTPRRFLKSLNDAIRSGAGIVMTFPPNLGP